MNPPPRPLSKRKMVQLMVILTILAWATQTLFHQWGYGATIEIRESATISGEQVVLKDVARWSGADAQLLDRISDTPVFRFAIPQIAKEISAADVRAALRMAKTQPTVCLAGSTSCLVTRTLSASRLLAQDVLETNDRQATTQPAFTVHPGDFITVTFSVGSSEFQTVLRAEEEGTLASTIRAKNEATGATHLVTLKSPTEATWIPTPTSG